MIFAQYIYIFRFGVRFGFQKPEARGRKPEAGSWRPAAGGQKPEAGARGQSRRPAPEARPEGKEEK